MIRRILILLQRTPSAIWRRVLSKPMGFLFRTVYQVKIGERPKFIGWPIFKGKGIIELGNNTVLVSSSLGNPIGLFRPCIIESISENSKIQIGSNFSASGVCIVSATEITIGNNVSMGANSTIVDTDFHASSAADRKNNRVAESKAVHIEDDVWIGMNAVILKGVKVSRGAVIGANAVVTKNVPEGARAVGNPARIIYPSHNTDEKAKSIHISQELNGKLELEG